MKSSAICLILLSLVACGQQSKAPEDLVPAYDGIYIVDGSGITQLTEINRTPGMSNKKVAIPGTQKKPSMRACVKDVENTVEAAETASAASFKYFALRNRMLYRIHIYVPVDLGDGSKDVMCRARTLKEKDVRTITKPGLTIIELIDSPEAGHYYEVRVPRATDSGAHPVIFE